MNSNAEPEAIELGTFLKIFANETDRGLALSAAAYLEQRLYEILISFLADVPASMELLEGFNAPLGTFSAKIKAAYSLGLIEENEYNHLNTIRKIRNKFSHSWENISFQNNDIKDHCKNFYGVGSQDKDDKSFARERFFSAVSLLALDLLWRARLVQEQKIIIKNWPHKIRNKKS